MEKVWVWFGFLVVLLILKMFAIAVFQGVQRLKNRAFTKPEDAAFFGKTEPLDAELPAVDRAQRALRNDLENIPMFLFLCISYIQLGCWSMGVLVYGSIFVMARVVHTIAYIHPKQPLRNRAYLLGVLCSMTMGGHIVLRGVSLLFA